MISACSSINPTLSECCPEGGLICRAGQCSPTKSKNWPNSMLFALSHCSTLPLEIQPISFLMATVTANSVCWCACFCFCLIFYNVFQFCHTCWYSILSVRQYPVFLQIFRGISFCWIVWLLLFSWLDSNLKMFFSDKSVIITRLTPIVQIGLFCFYTLHKGWLSQRN